ncbi:MAG: DSD1 family PLP-dependent enzyme [Chloroflexi bacterium]|nr:MAG: DSD1 family PLP-dependent enzyme [Chloroflexota bacterium]
MRSPARQQAKATVPELAPAAGAIQETRDRVKRAYGSAIGRHRRDLVTPALILDLPAARRNIAKMAERLKTMPAKIRPHIKVHKSPELARLQVDAGAIGLSTATIWEAIVMVRSGLDSIFIVNTLAGREKLAALAEIAREAEVMVAVDDPQNTADIAAAARTAGSEVGVLIEVDTGMDRAGLDTPEQAVELARRVAGMEGLELMGVTGYEGHCSLTPERDLRASRQRVAMSTLVDAAERIRAAGLPCPIVSAGGTATWDWTATTHGVTEIQAGSYAVMDNFHFPMAGDFEKALTVLATVISRPPDRVIVDAGNKSLGAPALSTMRGHDLKAMRFDEEHGLFIAEPDYPLHVGDVVELVPGYAPGTVNWYDAYHVVEGDRVVDVWPVIPRGPGHGGLIS